MPLMAEGSGAEIEAKKGNTTLHYEVWLALNLEGILNTRKRHFRADVVRGPNGYRCLPRQSFRVEQSPACCPGKYRNR